MISVSNVTVDYEDITAVDNVSFIVEPGMVYGLIGPNGAGKTSIMNAISGLLEPTFGEITIGGIDVLLEPRQALAKLGFMPDAPPLYDALKVSEFLELFASAYGLEPSERGNAIDKMLEQVNLTDKRDSQCGGLSRGMKQRLFLAKTLLHDPDVLVLDEPASGLDPHARMEFGQIIRQLGDRGKAVLVSSHILSEMAEFCNGVAIIERGHLKVSGGIDETLKSLRPGREIHGRLVEASSALISVLEAASVTEIQVDGVSFQFVMEGDDAAAATLLRQMVEAGLPVAEFRAHEKGLQDLFLEVSTGSVQ